MLTGIVQFEILYGYEHLTSMLKESAAYNVCIKEMKQAET